MAGSHDPTWQASLGAHVFGLPMHPPARHASFPVQAFPSLQLVPSGAVLQALVLVAGLHDWHGLDGFGAPAA